MPGNGAPLVIRMMAGVVGPEAKPRQWHRCHTKSDGGALADGPSEARTDARDRMLIP